MKLLNFLGKKTRITDFRGCAALIFSSDQAFLDYYRSMIVSLGLTPMTALTSESALGILRMKRVALVVVDEGRGASACRQVLEGVRKFQKRPAVLAISPYGDSLFRAEALKLGVADFLGRPAVRDDFLRALLPSYPRPHPSVP